VYFPLCFNITANAAIVCLLSMPISVLAQGQTSAAVTAGAQSASALDPASHGGDDPPKASGLASDDLGKTTIDLLSLQASGRAAAPGVPIPGDQETASYKRYIDTFSKPIPDFFSNTIKSNSGS